MKQGYIAAVDIGTTKIVAIVGKRNIKGQIEVLGMGKTESRGVARGEVINIDYTVSSVRKAVAIAEEQAGVKIDDVYVGIAGKHIRCTQNRGYISKDTNDRVITKDDVERLVKEQYNVLTNPGEEIIHVLPQTFLVDNEYDVVDPIGMLGRKLEANFHMVIGKVDSISYIKQSIIKSDLNPVGIILEPLASAEAVLADEEKEIGVVLVDIGGGTTDIAVYYDNVIRHTAVIPFGGKAITNDIKEGCYILERQAEELKTRHGSALMDYADPNKIISVAVVKGRDPKEISLKSLAGIIQARMEEIIDSIIYEVEASGVHEKLGAGVVLTGGGSQLKHLRQLVAFKTGMETRIGTPNEKVYSEIQELNNPMFATVIGLLMKGFNASIYNENIPENDLVKEFSMDISTPTVEPEVKKTTEAPKQAEQKVLFEDDEAMLKEKLKNLKKENKTQKAAMKKESSQSRFTEKIKEGFLKLFDDENDDTKMN